jgi:hypothetical protein
MSENTDYETLKAERDAALNTCTLIAEALGITGAVAGDAIARVQQLVGENAALKSAIEFATAPDMWEEHGDLLEYKYLDWYVDVLNKALDGTPATTQAINEIKAQGAIEFAEFLKVQAKESLSRGDHYVFDRLNAQAVTAERFAASLRGNN